MMCDKNNALGEIYSRIMGHCPPYSLPPPWDMLPNRLEIRGPVADPPAALAELAQVFTTDDLHRARAVVLGPEGIPVLNPALCCATSAVLPLRYAAGENPFDLLVDQGCLSERWLPVCAGLSDFRIRQAMDRGAEVLCIAPSMADVAVLLTMGLPSTLSAGLRNLGRKELEDVCHVFQLKRAYTRQGGLFTHMPGDPAFGPSATIDPMTRQNLPQTARPAEMLDVLDASPDLMIVAWSPSQLTLVAAEDLSAVVAHLVAVEQRLEIALDQVSVWRPDARELERVRFCVQYGHRGDVKQALAVSMEASAFALADFHEEHGVPDGYPAARERFSETLRRSPASPEAVVRARVDLERAMDRELVRPLGSMAAAAKEPMQANLLAAAADVAELMHRQAMLLRVRTTTSVHNAGGQHHGDVSREELLQYLATMDRLLAINRELAERRPRPSTSRKA
jgi:hypothetical protein